MATADRPAGTALRAMGFVAYPAMAGAAFCVLSLGVVTWLPALTAVACALRAWRTDGDTRCFLGVFAAFPQCARALWRHGVASTAALAVLAANLLFLAGKPGPVAFGLFALQCGVAAALAPYHLALAATADPKAALGLAFGSPGRGLALLAAAVAAPVLTLVIPLGPLLLGPSLPVLFTLILQESTPPRERFTRP